MNLVLLTLSNYRESPADTLLQGSIEFTIRLGKYLFTELFYPVFDSRGVGAVEQSTVLPSDVGIPAAKFAHAVVQKADTMLNI